VLKGCRLLGNFGRFIGLIIRKTAREKFLVNFFYGNDFVHPSKHQSNASQVQLFSQAFGPSFPVASVESSPLPSCHAWFNK
jgi:hypothetical protein